MDIAPVSLTDLCLDLTYKLIEDSSVRAVLGLTCKSFNLLAIRITNRNFANVFGKHTTICSNFQYIDYIIGELMSNLELAKVETSALETSIKFVLDNDLIDLYESIIKSLNKRKFRQYLGEEVFENDNVKALEITLKYCSIEPNYLDIFCDVIPSFETLKYLNKKHEYIPLKKNITDHVYKGAYEDAKEVLEWYQSLKRKSSLIYYRGSDRYHRSRNKINYGDVLHVIYDEGYKSRYWDEDKINGVNELFCLVDRSIPRRLLNLAIQKGYSNLIRWIITNKKCPCTAETINYLIQHSKYMNGEVLEFIILIEKNYGVRTTRYGYGLLNPNWHWELNEMRESRS